MNRGQDGVGGIKRERGNTGKERRHVARMDDSGKPLGRMANLGSTNFYFVGGRKKWVRLDCSVLKASLFGFWEMGVGDYLVNG